MREGGVPQYTPASGPAPTSGPSPVRIPPTPSSPPFPSPSSLPRQPTGSPPPTSSPPFPPTPDHMAGRTGVRVFPPTTPDQRKTDDVADPLISPPVAAPGDPSPPPRPGTRVETLGFGEIIYAHNRQEQTQMPSVGRNVVIADFKKVSLKWKELDAVECDCDVFINETNKPQLRYLKTSDSALVPRIIPLVWLKSGAPSPPPISSAAAAAGGGGEGAAAALVSINQALYCHSEFRYSMVLRLQDGDLLLQFQSDADVSKWDRAIKHVHGFFTAFEGQGHRLDYVVPQKDREKYVIISFCSLIFVPLSTCFAAGTRLPTEQKRPCPLALIPLVLSFIERDQTPPTLSKTEQAIQNSNRVWKTSWT